MACWFDDYKSFFIGPTRRISSSSQSGTIKVNTRINKFKVDFALLSCGWVCLWNNLPLQHSQGMPAQNLIFFFIRCRQKKSKNIRKSKTNEKLLFTIDPENLKAETRMTLTSEILGATEWRIFSENFPTFVLKRKKMRVNRFVVVRVSREFSFFYSRTYRLLAYWTEGTFKFAKMIKIKKFK